jgi:hypothetical protein
MNLDDFIITCFWMIDEMGSGSREGCVAKICTEATGRGEGFSNPSGCYSKETGDE